MVYQPHTREKHVDWSRIFTLNLRLYEVIVVRYVGHINIASNRIQFLNPKWTIGPMKNGRHVRRDCLY